MNITKVVETFFRYDAPCPSEIPNCQDIRNKFQQEMSEARLRDKCNGCSAASVKSKYTEIIWDKALVALSEQNAKLK